MEGGFAATHRHLPARLYLAVGADGLTRGLKSVYGRKSIFEAMLREIQDRGLDRAVELYHKLKEEDAEQYSFAESELNGLGYYLLANKQVSEAIAVFELNVAAYPNTWNAYDSLGEAYMMRGDVALAVRNCQKSLELAPDNAGAADMLRKLQEQGQ